MVELPCLRLSGMSDADKRAYVITDNKLALNAGWEIGLLAGELEELSDLGFDVQLTGFELPEIDTLLNEVAEASVDPVGAADERPRPVSPSVTRPGNRWTLGRHVLACGDAKDPTVLEALRMGWQADMIFTDPPYNVSIKGHVSGMGQTRHREFVEAVAASRALKF